MRTDFKNKRIKVNIKKCLACHACQMGCIVAHSKSGHLFEAIEEKEKPVSRIIITEKKDKIIAVYCQQCKNAPCIAACSEGAMERLSEMDPVVINREKCNGCGDCITICPFEAIRKSSNGNGVVKCDLCVDLLIESKDPACVVACPTRAIELVLTKSKRLAE